MRIVICVVFMILVLSKPSLAFDDWSKQDVALQAVFTSLHIIDWGNTLYIADNPRYYSETNMILGKHPNRGNVNLYFAGTLAGSVLVTHILPKKYRPYFQTIIISIETAAMANNHAVGIGMRF